MFNATALLRSFRVVVVGCGEFRLGRRVEPRPQFNVRRTATENFV